MNGIQFGSYHSYDDLHLILKKKEIGSPEIKKMQVEVEGMDGVLDYTEMFGEIKYTNRYLRFEFSILQKNKPFMDAYSEIQDVLHGQKVNITLDESPEWYYVGRLSISPFTNEKCIGQIAIECDCEPYKLKATETVVSQSITGTATIQLVNSRKRVVPQITTTADMVFGFNGSTYAVSAGTFFIPELELSEGLNTVSITGTGNVEFRYREGRL